MQKEFKENLNKGYDRVYVLRVSIILHPYYAKYILLRDLNNNTVLYNEQYTYIVKSWILPILIICTYLLYNRVYNTIDCVYSGSNKNSHKMLHNHYVYVLYKYWLRFYIESFFHNIPCQKDT